MSLFKSFYEILYHYCNKAKVFDKGKNNSIYLCPKQCHGHIKINGDYNTFRYLDKDHILNADVQIRGNNNKIIIGENFSKTNTNVLQADIKNSSLTLNINLYGDNNNFLIGYDVDGILSIYIEGGQFKVSNCSLRIGNNTHIGHPTKMIFEENNTQINIGNQCLLSENIEFWCSDTHSILDKNTNTVLNTASNISVGNNVWIARNVHFNKNTAIANNSVVAHHSIITKKFTQQNVIIAGSPATIRKQNITWDLQRPDLYTKRDNIKGTLTDEQKH